MKSKKREILETFGRTIPGMSELEKEKLVSFAQGIAFAKEQQEERDAELKQLRAMRDALKAVSVNE